MKLARFQVETRVQVVYRPRYSIHGPIERQGGGHAVRARWARVLLRMHRALKTDERRQGRNQLCRHP